MKITLSMSRWMKSEVVDKASEKVAEYVASRYESRILDNLRNGALASAERTLVAEYEKGALSDVKAYLAQKVWNHETTTRGEALARIVVEKAVVRILERHTVELVERVFAEKDIEECIDEGDAPIL